MSYYILPKMNNEIIIEPKYIFFNQQEHVKPILSKTLCHYLQDVHEQCNKLCFNEVSGELMCDLDSLYKMVNPHEYIFSKLPGSKFSVGKLKPFSNLFYDILEIIYSLSLFDHYNNTSIQTLHFGQQNRSSIECINMIREFNQDTHIAGSNYDQDEIENRYDFIYYEMDDIEQYKNSATYIHWLIETIYHIFSHQNENGIAIIRVDHIFLKPVLDILYILSCSYEKIYLIKPNTSNIITTDKYIVCKKLVLLSNPLSILYLSNTLEKILQTIKQDNRNITVLSIIKNEIPCFLLNKIEEFNIILGQQQLNAMDLLISIMKSKNKEEKMDALKKSHIQKCIAWCDKYKIPNNKFNDKVNIFLPLRDTNENDFDDEDIDAC